MTVTHYKVFKINKICNNESRKNCNFIKTGYTIYIKY